MKVGQWVRYKHHIIVEGQYGCTLYHKEEIRIHQIQKVEDGYCIVNNNYFLDNKNIIKVKDDRKDLIEVDDIVTVTTNQHNKQYIIEDKEFIYWLKNSIQIWKWTMVSIECHENRVRQNIEGEDL